MKQQPSRPKHSADETQDHVKLHINKDPFHLELELDKDKVIRISFLSADDPRSHSSSTVHPHVSKIEAYLCGKCPELDLPYQLRASEFARHVYEQTLEIPRGKTATYAQIAAAIGSPKAVRAVGAALGANPLPLIIPCHRVIGSNGKLTGFAGGLHLKRLLLALEQES